MITAKGRLKTKEKSVDDKFFVSAQNKKIINTQREIEDSDLVVFNCSSLALSAVSAFYKSLMCNIKIKNSLMTMWSLFRMKRCMWVEKYLCTQRHAPLTHFYADLKVFICVTTMIIFLHPYQITNSYSSTLSFRRLFMHKTAKKIISKSTVHKKIA